MTTLGSETAAPSEAPPAVRLDPVERAIADIAAGKAVVVVAPEQRESAIAIGPGLLIEVGNLHDLNQKSLRSFIDARR